MKLANLNQCGSQTYSIAQSVVFGGCMTLRLQPSRQEKQTSWWRCKRLNSYGFNFPANTLALLLYGLPGWPSECDYLTHMPKGIINAVQNIPERKFARACITLKDYFHGSHIAVFGRSEYISCSFNILKAFSFAALQRKFCIQSIFTFGIFSLYLVSCSWDCKMLQCFFRWTRFAISWGLVGLNCKSSGRKASVYQ